MSLKQHTIKESVSIEGIGLHTGASTTLTFLPAEPNHGIKFQRVDLEGAPVIPALADKVVDTSRGTTIAEGEATVSTIEHALSAVVSLEIEPQWLLITSEVSP